MDRRIKKRYTQLIRLAAARPSGTWPLALHTPEMRAFGTDRSFPDPFVLGRVVNAVDSDEDLALGGETERSWLALELHELARRSLMRTVEIVTPGLPVAELAETGFAGAIFLVPFNFIWAVLGELKLGENGKRLALVVIGVVDPDICDSLMLAADRVSIAVRV